MKWIARTSGTALALALALVAAGARSQAPSDVPAAEAAPLLDPEALAIARRGLAGNAACAGAGAGAEALDRLIERHGLDVAA